MNSGKSNQQVNTAATSAAAMPFRRLAIVAGFNSLLLVTSFLLIILWLMARPRQVGPDGDISSILKPSSSATAAANRLVAPATVVAPPTTRSYADLTARRLVAVNVLYGPAMRDEHYTAMLGDSLRPVIDDEYRTFFRAIALSRDDYIALRKYLTDRRLALFEAESLAHTTPEQVMNAELAATSQIDGEIREHFGDQLADQLAAYDHLPRGVHQQMDDVIGTINATNEPLSTKQIDALLALYVSNAGGGKNTLAQITGESSIPDSVVEQSKTFLSRSQQALLQTLQHDQQLANPAKPKSPR